MVTVVTQLSESASQALRAGVAPEDSDAGSLAALADAAGGVLRAQHPNVEDRNLARWFIVQDVNETRAARLVESLLAHPEVEAAYVKPVDEPA